MFKPPNVMVDVGLGEKLSHRRGSLDSMAEKSGRGGRLGRAVGGGEALDHMWMEFWRRQSVIKGICATVIEDDRG